MLFHQKDFLLLFMPAAIIGYLILKKLSRPHIVTLLILCSASFYCIYNIYNIFVITFSIIINFHLGSCIYKYPNKSIFLVIGIAFNVLYLGIFKYSDFIIENINIVLDTKYEYIGIELPLAISFFTFQQIAYLIDTKKGLIKSNDFKIYSFFVIFFPQLIAGPIVRFQQIVEQVHDQHFLKNSSNHFIAGFCLFSIGLAKKLIMADGISTLTEGLFIILESNKIPSIAEAWIGMISFGLQIYYDFSAYSDMAIGLALMFGIRLPINFDSPYKSQNIVDFWRRWHITLSQFLRDYLYIPLGGNRSGKIRGCLNALLVMTIGGLWHGASWTFLFWGFFHGTLIGLTHFSSNLLKKRNPLSLILNQIINNKYFLFFLITLSWVLFRSDNFLHAKIIYESLFGMNGIDISRSFSSYFSNSNVRCDGFLPNHTLDLTIIPFLPFFLIHVWYLPNSNQLIGLDKKIREPSNIIQLLCLIYFFISIKISFEDTFYDFIYFKF
jgi:D-alanyl-lipoteichoic acid acyltransferase DltB (MBOAT superfamily)